MSDRHCFAPGCKSGYTKYRNEKVSLFKVPKNMLEVWSAAIPRKDKKLTINNSLCEKHFLAEDVIREVKTETYAYSLKIPRLKENAIPCNWPNCPSYISKRPAKKRRIIERKEYEHATTKGNEVQNEVSDTPTTSKGYQKTETTSPDIDLQAKAPDNQLGLHELFNILWKQKIKIALPSETWTIKYYGNIVAIFETAAIEEDIVTTKKILITKSFIKFFVFQHLYDHLTEDSLKISSFHELEKTIVDFDRLSICFGLINRDSLSLDFSRTRYRQDASSKSVRHENCKYILTSKKNLLKNRTICVLCVNAKQSIWNLKKCTNVINQKKEAYRRNCIGNMRKREKRARYRIQLLKREIKKMRTVNAEEILKKIGNLPMI